jgi:hypothetical protein
MWLQLRRQLPLLSLIRMFTTAQDLFLTTLQRMSHLRHRELRLG